MTSLHVDEQDIFEKRSDKTRDKPRRPIIMAFLFDEDYNVLMIKDEDASKNWKGVTGKVEDATTGKNIYRSVTGLELLQTVYREVTIEELGHRFKFQNPRFSLYSMLGDRGDYLDTYVFFLEDKGQAFTPTDDEVTKKKWVGLEELAEIRDTYEQEHRFYHIINDAIKYIELQKEK